MKRAHQTLRGPSNKQAESPCSFITRTWHLTVRLLLFPWRVTIAAVGHHSCFLFGGRAWRPSQSLHVCAVGNVPVVVVRTRGAFVSHTTKCKKAQSFAHKGINSHGRSVIAQRSVYLVWCPPGRMQYCIEYARRSIATMMSSNGQHVPNERLISVLDDEEGNHETVMTVDEAANPPAYGEEPSH
jgi:hypothetical protein